MVAHVHPVYRQAVAMLPCVAHLQVAEPSVAVEGTLLLLVVEGVHIIPASVVVVLGLDALVGQIVKVGREVSLEHVAAIADVDDIAVEEADKVLSAHVKHVVARAIMLVHLHAAGAEQLWNVVFAEESRTHLEAPAAPEGPEDVTDADHRVTNHAMVITEHLMGDVVDG